jgi:hypothetical protein
MGRPPPGYRPPLAVCSRCGRERPCYRARSERPLCETCRRRGWQPPVATCSRCGRRRPCHHADGDAPVCRSCAVALRVARCASCGRTARVAGRTAKGPECSVCRTRRLNARLDCPRCGAAGRPSVADPDVCERCAGEPVRQVCRTCGVQENNYADGCCARCMLTERLDALTATGDRAVVARLEPYLAALRDGPKPWSVLNWMTVSAGYQTLVELVAGRVELSYEGLDGVGRGQSTAYLRAAVVRAGVMPARHEKSAGLDAFIRAQAARLLDGEDRSRLRAFAVWEVRHDLKRRERRGRTARASGKLARARISVAVELIAWLHAHGMTLRDLRQEHLDCWLADGSSTQRRIRAFLDWGRRGGLLPDLEAPWAEARRHTDPLDAHQRLRLVGALLSDDTLDLRDRVAGCLLLVFAQPVTRIVRLTVDDVDDHARPVRLRLGPEPLELPEPLGALVAELKQRRPGLATTAVGEPARWLFPGLRLDAPLHPEHLRRRLRKLGIVARPGRAAALLHLAQTLPPAILADLLGISESHAARWTTLAAGDWARYAAEASQQPPRA